MLRGLQTEASYAYNLHKRIIPLRMEADYQPDGWLGPLCLNNLWYDFSTPEKFDDEWSRLEEQLTNVQPAQNSSDTGSTL